MQTDPHWQEQILARFILSSRHHLDLVRASASIRPPRLVAGPTRKLLRSLVILSSLGALFGATVFARKPAANRPSAARTSTAPG